MILPLFEDSIRYFLSRERPVYLDRFGILFPRLRTVDRAYLKDTQLIFRKETARTIEFEKCANVTRFHREQYSSLVELKDLAQRIFALLPIHHSLGSSERVVREGLEEIISKLSVEVITKGTSSLLPSLGTFYALHNQQGEQFKDWFAGADIFLYSHFSELVATTPGVIRERPILESSWELLEAAYGPALMTTEVDLLKQLGGLGYDIGDLPNEVEHSFPLAIFQAYDSREKTHYLLYCSDGLRNQGLRAKRSRGYGTELVLQLPIGAALVRENKRDLASIPLWPLRALTMGWILMQSSPSHTLRAGLKMCEDRPLLPDSDSELSSIFTSQFAQAREEQLSSSGPFFYVNLVGITSDEYTLAERNSSEQLRTILDYKKLLQFTKPLRSSVTARSALSQNAKREKSPYILTDPRLANALEGTHGFVPA